MTSSNYPHVARWVRDFGWIVPCTLGDNLNFPLQAEVMGEPVEAIGLNNRRSSLRKGIVVRVRSAPPPLAYRLHVTVAVPATALYTVGRVFVRDIEGREQLR